MQIREEITPELLIQLKRHLNNSQPLNSGGPIMWPAGSAKDLAIHPLPVLRANAYGALEAEQKPRSRSSDFRKSLLLRSRRGR